jgi:hypothetical protein
VEQERPTTGVMEGFRWGPTSDGTRGGPTARRPGKVGAAGAPAILLPQPAEPPMTRNLTPLEDATVRFVLAHAAESDGWLDLTRISSRTARMLPDVRQTVQRLVRRGVLRVDESAPNTERWMRFVVETPAS